MAGPFFQGFAAMASRPQPGPIASSLDPRTMMPGAGGPQSTPSRVVTGVNGKPLRWLTKQDIAEFLSIMGQLQNSPAYNGRPLSIYEWHQEARKYGGIGDRWATPLANFFQSFAGANGRVPTVDDFAQQLATGYAPDTGQAYGTPGAPPPGLFDENGYPIMGPGSGAPNPQVGAPKPPTLVVPPDQASPIGGGGSFNPIMPPGSGGPRPGPNTQINPPRVSPAPILPTPGQQPGNETPAPIVPGPSAPPGDFEGPLPGTPKPVKVTPNPEMSAPLPHQFNPIVFDAFTATKTGRGLLKSIVEAGRTPGGAYQYDDYVRQHQASRPTGKLPGQILTAFGVPTGYR